jgi:hypothetical protein
MAASMKVVGTGSPMMLSLRIKSCEVAVVREVLCRRRAEAVAAAAGSPASPPPAAADAEERHDEMFVIAKLLDDVRRHVPGGQPQVLEGPTWLLDPVIRDAASEAVERLSEAVDLFRADRGRMSRDGLRAAVDTASACAATLIALDYVQNHAVV